MRVETFVCQELYVLAAVFLAKFGAEKGGGPIRTAELSPKSVFTGCSVVWALPSARLVVLRRSPG